MFCQTEKHSNQCSSLIVLSIFHTYDDTNSLFPFYIVLTLDVEDGPSSVASG